MGFVFEREKVTPAVGIKFTFEKKFLKIQHASKRDIK